MIHCDLGVLIQLTSLIWAEARALKWTVWWAGYENLNECRLEII